MKLSFTSSLGLAALGIGLFAYFNRMRWNHRTLQILEELCAPVAADESQVVSFECFSQLPEPVAKYLRFALTEGQLLVRSVRIRQVGELRSPEKAPGGWMPFRAKQYFSAQPLGFVWDASVEPFPLCRIRVRDSYHAGQGEAEVEALSLWMLAEEHGSAELAAGSLMRHLAESVWFPTALLPSANLLWTPLTSDRALATLTDSHTTVSLEFQFNKLGEIVSVYTPGRCRAVSGKFELTPWSGQHRSYVKKDGMQVPTESEAFWHLPTGVTSVWKAHLVDFVYEHVK